MELYLVALIILASLAIFDLMVGVSNDAVNFLNSSIGSRVAPRYVIMIIASLGILAGVTFSSGMMEVARKGIFHPRLFMMPELIAIFLAVMLTDVILLDLFNTFGLPTSTTVSIVFELLGAAVAVSLIKIHMSGEGYSMLVNYINTGKALVIIAGILLSVVVAFFCGVVAQFATRLLFTFDYIKRLKRYSGVWGGIALAIITYFILIKGAKGTSFLSTETITWIKTHTWIIFFMSFIVFGFIFQFLTLFTKINILKPIVLIGTFALAMAFASNDLVNFIGVPLAGLSAYKVAATSAAPLTITMDALQESIQSNTLLLLIAGAIMVATLWVSRKARTVTRTEVSLGRQDEGIERFGSSALSRTIVRIVHFIFDITQSLTPVKIKAKISKRLDPSAYKPALTLDGETPSFDLLRASVNLIMASAIISFATSLKLPLSTTYVTFMVAMGTSLADQAWGRESAVYRITGVLSVIGGWFFTAFAAFTISMIFAFLISLFKLTAIIFLLILAVVLVMHTYRYHIKKEEETSKIEAYSQKSLNDADTAIGASFEQTGEFLMTLSNNLNINFEAAIAEDIERLKESKSKAGQMHKWANIIIENIFNTLFLLQKNDLEDTRRYSSAIRSLQAIAESHRDIVIRTSKHFENYHAGFQGDQKDELRRLKTFLNRLLWNTSIMLSRRKKVDYDYIEGQCLRIINLVKECEKNQIDRIQSGRSQTRLSVLFYSLLENSVKISERTKELLDIFKECFDSSRAC
jgi:phosphate/sulfate permease